MRFTLIDRITDFEPGNHLTAVKNLSLAEEYLADHFPGFPVMPGVLMMEAMTQAGAWLIRASEDFAHSVVVLKEARNVRFKNFVKPAQTLQVTVAILRQDERHVKIKAEGLVGDRPTVSARMTLERYNFADEDPTLASKDAEVVRKMRELFSVLRDPKIVPPASLGNPSQ
ncbi:MAG: beta-hydroxyacyl-ACP dehydratase [Planctomycetales bacterium]